MSLRAFCRREAPFHCSLLFSCMVVDDHCPAFARCIATCSCKGLRRFGLVWQQPGLSGEQELHPWSSHPSVGHRVVLAAVWWVCHCTKTWMKQKQSWKKLSVCKLWGICCVWYTSINVKKSYRIFLNHILSHHLDELFPGVAEPSMCLVRGQWHFGSQLPSLPPNTHESPQPSASHLQILDKKILSTN